MISLGSGARATLVWSWRGRPLVADGTANDGPPATSHIPPRDMSLLKSSPGCGAGRRREAANEARLWSSSSGRSVAPRPAWRNPGEPEALAGPQRVAEIRAMSKAFVREDAESEEPEGEEPAFGPGPRYIT